VKFYVLPPCRVVDTRNPSGPDGGPALSAGTSRTFPVTGQCGVPAGAVSVTGNVTAVTPSVAGDLRIYPGGTAVPMTSTVNFKAGQTRANNGIFGLGSGGIAVQTDMASGTTHFLLDVSGYFR
jgi:hypothetical protein